METITGGLSCPNATSLSSIHHRGLWWPLGSADLAPTGDITQTPTVGGASVQHITVTEVEGDGGEEEEEVVLRLSGLESSVPLRFRLAAPASSPPASRRQIALTTGRRTQARGPERGESGDARVTPSAVPKRVVI